MNNYILIGSEQDLLDNGFTYRPDYDNFCSVYMEESWETNQSLVIEIDSKTKKVNIYIHSLNGHRNKPFVEESIYIIQADIYPIYFKVINSLVEKNIIKEKENDNNCSRQPS